MPAVRDDIAGLDLLCSQVTGAAASFDAWRLDRDATVAAMAVWTAIVNSGEAALALAAARLDECGPPPSAGASSASDFVAKQTGITSAKATDRIKTGHGLHAKMRTRECATSGRLSADQAAAITDALMVVPDAEDTLLGVADTASVGGLRDACARAKAAHQDVAAIEKRIHAKRSLRRYRDAEGAEHLHAVGTRRDLARLDQAIKPLVDEIFKNARANGLREPLDAYQFDALMALADGQVAERKNPTIRHLGVLQIDWSALVRGTTEDGETCEIAGLGPVSVETAREMLGESILKLVITKGVDVVNVTHLGRGPKTAQKVALLWQLPERNREGCNRTARVEYDHRDAYRITKHTRLDELDPACKPDHDLKTYHGWDFVEGTGKRPMVPPDDPRHPKNRPPP